MFVSLYCRDCDNTDCILRPLGSPSSKDWDFGCTRYLSEDEYAEYEHIYKEMLPFIGMGQYCYDISQIERFNDKLFHSRIGALLDIDGKVDNRKRKIIDKLNKHVI